MVDHPGLSLDPFYLNIGQAVQTTQKAEQEPPDTGAQFCTSSTPTTSWHTEVQPNV